MKKSILNLGKTLSKTQQKEINGGTPPGLVLCDSSCVDHNNKPICRC